MGAWSLKLSEALRMLEAPLPFLPEPGKALLSCLLPGVVVRLLIVRPATLPPIPGLPDSPTLRLALLSRCSWQVLYSPFLRPGQPLPSTRIAHAPAGQSRSLEQTWSWAGQG